MLKNNVLITVIVIALLQLSCSQKSSPIGLMPLLPPAPVPLLAPPAPEIAPAPTAKNIYIIYPDTATLSENIAFASPQEKITVKNKKYHFVPNYCYVYFNKRIKDDDDTIEEDDIIIHTTQDGEHIASPVKDIDGTWKYYMPNNTIKSVLWKKHKKKQNKPQKYRQIGVINKTRGKDTLTTFKKAKKITITLEQYTFLKALKTAPVKYKYFKKYLETLNTTTQKLTQTALIQLLAPLKKQEYVITLSETQYKALKKLEGYTPVDTQYFTLPLLPDTGWVFKKKGEARPFRFKKIKDSWEWQFWQYNEKRKKSDWIKKPFTIPDENSNNTLLHNALINYSTGDLDRLKKKKSIRISTHLISSDKRWEPLISNKCEKSSCKFLTLTPLKTYTILWANGEPDSLVNTDVTPMTLTPFEKTFKLKLKPKLRKALTVLYESQNYKTLEITTLTKALKKNYPIQHKGLYLDIKQSGTFCDVDVRNRYDYQYCQQKLYPHPNKSRAVSWKRNITATGGTRLWKEAPSYYTQTVIHSSNEEAQYIFQVKDNNLYRNRTTIGTTLQDKQLVRKGRGYWLVVDAYKDAGHIYSLLFDEARANKWLSDLKIQKIPIQLDMLLGKKLGSSENRVNRYFDDKALPQKALLQLSSESRDKDIKWEMHIHLPEKSMPLKMGSHRKLAHKLSALQVDRLFVWGYTYSNLKSDHQYKAFFEEVVKQSKGKIQMKYVKVCADNKDKVHMPYTVLQSCPIKE